MFEAFKYIVVGAGLFGSVVAERIASQKNERVLVVERRSHIGGNCFSEVDEKSGIEIHRYGSHIFHTDNMGVWEYLQNFMGLNGYRHHVFTSCCGHVYQMPINLFTVNHFYGCNLKPWQMSEFLRQEIDKENIGEPQNLEEKAISLIGRPLYEAFIKGYTAKQWETDPAKLPADIITRLPFRTNFNADYFNDPIQGIPVDGYTSIFERLLHHKNIEIRLNTDFLQMRESFADDVKVIYTGPIDEFFDYCHGRLSWRTLDFVKEVHEVDDYQGTAVMNYADEEIPYTRIHEFKHYHPERSCEADMTVITREYSRFAGDNDEPYYPIATPENMHLYEQYLAMRPENVFFGGRLGSYRYYDMDDAVAAALHFYDENIDDFQEG